MQYPKFMKTLNKWLARFSGGVILGISILAVFEAISRQLFGMPTNWTLNMSCYIFLWAIFLGSSYAFQEHGHVAVDLLRDFIDKKTSPSRMPRRVISIIGYVLAFIVISIFLYGGWKLCVKGIELNQLAPVTFHLPLIWIYPAIVVGCILMLLTLFFIILDLFSSSETYL